MKICLYIKKLAISPEGKERMLEKLIELLGKDNTQKLEDGITDIILDQIRNDFDDSETYILSPDDVIEFAERCKERAFKSIESDLIQKMENDMRKSLSLLSGE